MPCTQVWTLPGHDDEQRQYDDEQRQYASTATTPERKSKKAEHRFSKHGSSDDSDGEETHHYAHLSFVNDVFPREDRERKEDIYKDGGEMPFFHIFRIRYQ